MSDLVAKGDYVEGCKVNVEEHNRTKKTVNIFSEVMGDAAVDTEDEFYSRCKFSGKEVEHKTYDDTKNINYHDDEVKHDLFHEEVLLKKRQLVIQKKG